MMVSLPFAAGLLLFCMGLLTAAARRSFLVVLMGAAVAVLGAVLAMIAAALRHGSAVALASALVFLVLATAMVVAATATALATYRRRGTENLDELTELSG